MMKSKVRNFFKQTFRRHTNMEYAELLTRGIRGKKGVNRKYPWAYCRLFALLFVLLAVFLLIVRFTYNELFAPTIIVLSSTCFNLAFLMLLYELYPKRDLSYLAVLLAMLIGGTAANVVSQILFDVFPIENKWLSAVCTGFFEELPKAVATLVVLIAAKNRSPLAGFLFGAAIGCGFSIVEDMGYIFVSSNELSSLNLTTVIEIAFSRGATAFCTHILWTGAIGWAFNISKRLIANIVVYPVILLSCGLHIAWDLPLNNVAKGIVCGACALVALLECAVIIKLERNKVFAESVTPVETAASAETATSSGADATNADEDTLQKTDPAYWRHWGYVSLVISAVLMAIIACIYCSIPFRERYGSETFYSADTFIEFMQDGAQLSAGDRAYDSSMSASDTLSGEYIVQSVSSTALIGGEQRSVIYEYWYYGTTKKYLYKTAVEIDGITYMREDIYNNGEVYASFFRLTEAVVTGYNFDSRGNITVFIYDADYARDLTDPRYTSLFYTFAALTGAATVCYIALRMKSWRVKKLCSMNSVSSAE
ncbi:MAG: PrsW family glutamic-type intramembrane protease [Candidatus Coproplasma sp.]